MKKVLFVATVVKTHINVFHLPYLKLLKQNGYETHVCARNDFDEREECHIPFCDKYFDLPFERSPFNYKNLLVYKKLSQIIEEEDYDIIHCHTPMGGVLARLSAIKNRKKGTRVIYTAHGFHFYRGAPIINWLMYFPVEKFLAKYTDTIITINMEDYKRVQNFKTPDKQYLPGVGIDLNKYNTSIDKNNKREELGISSEDLVLLSIGELSKRKNHEVIIRALSKINDKKITYIICGQGGLDMYLKDLALSLNVNVKFLGFRKDIPDICSASDIFIFPSLQEGLPVALMEAMAAGLPVICSNIRGNIDLIKQDRGGYLVESDNVDGFQTSIIKLTDDATLRRNMGNYNVEEAKKYDKQIILNQMKKIYHISPFK
ncbi:glycosyltransferase family 4 protein [Bacillus sp. AGMB 02131]|uniref:Glycosyltransferase family 4 protein n=1 Tax=Peribacillus faecalis TaxID=2772559 RepID=A0A927CTH5_9BACI|nr:glycosyltransferase family 4 protein [Peribacillus faecalis]MBD3107146.1 glycosyltransferase family 4 protein [Peribacillus faecalis]